MDWFGKTLQIIATLLALLILIGGAALLIRGSFNKAKVQELREDNDDLRKRLADAENKIRDHAARESALEVKVDHQQSEIEMLTEMVTQRAEVSVLAQSIIDLYAELKKHHGEAIGHWSSMEVALEALLSGGRKS